MQTILRDSRQRSLILLALVWAVGPAVLLYLLVLQLPFRSYLRLGIGGMLLPFFGLLAYPLLSRPSSISRGRWFLIALGSALLALLAGQALSFFPQKIYPFFGQHNLVLTLLSQESGQSFELRGVRTSLGSVSYSSFESVEGWERQGNKLVPISWPPPPLVWKGWTGDFARLDVAGPQGTLIKIAWDGQPETLKVDESHGNAATFLQHFDIPLWGRLSLFLLLWWALHYALASALFFYTRPAERSTGEAPAWLAKSFLALTFLGLGLFLLRTYLEIHPSLTFPGRDSSIFLYIGRQVLQGQIPYRDVWDHKGPLIYYIDALGLLLGRDSAVGVWYLELTWMAITIFLLFRLLQKLLGAIPAAVGSLIFLIGLGKSLSGGNFGEEYVLLFQVLALTSFVTFLDSREARWLFLAGLVTGCAFLVRPNQLSAGLGIGLYLLVFAAKSRFSRRHIGYLFSLLAGLLLPCAFFGLYFLLQGALGQALSAVFVFNRIYVGPLSFHPLQAFRDGLVSFPALGFWIVSGLVVLYVRLVVRSHDSARDCFWIALGLCAGAELVLSNLSHTGFKHYYITWLPYVACLAACLVSAILDLMRAAGACWPRAFPAFLHGMAILLALPGLFRLSADVLTSSSLSPWRQSAPAWWTPESPVNRLSPYLQPGAKLLMWGNEVSFNFILQVDAPSRFVYQYALMTPAYATDAMVDEIISALAAQRTVIVDASAGNLDSIPLERARRRDFLAQPGKAKLYGYLQPFFDYFDLNYQPVGSISRNWGVYVPVQ